MDQSRESRTWPGMGTPCVMEVDSCRPWEQLAVRGLPRCGDSSAASKGEPSVPGTVDRGEARLPGRRWGHASSAVVQETQTVMTVAP